MTLPFQLRNRHFFIIDIVILAIAPTLALSLRLDTLRFAQMLHVPLLVYTVLSASTYLLVFFGAGLYRRFWRYASIAELLRLGLAVLIATAFCMAGMLIAHAFGSPGLPRSMPLIEGLLVFLAVGGVRFSLRMTEARWPSYTNTNTKRVLVAGAGDAGAMVVREMKRNPERGLQPVGFVDDDPGKSGLMILGIPVLGTRHDIPSLVEHFGIDEVVIAMPTVSGQIIRDIVKLCEQTRVATKTVPGMYEILDGSLAVEDIRSVDIEDLLRREPIKTDIEAVRKSIRGKRILVTGAGGSIGSELCRQIAECTPAELLILGHGENSIFEIFGELRSMTEGQSIAIKPLIADIRFGERISALIRESNPDMIFHAAAHKHVPLMEMNPVEAVTNNTLGTRNLLQAAVAAGVSKFVMISTDKAVNPTSVMGATKRVAELLVLHTARTHSLPYVAVRFGNVLGSRGSVVLTFRKQIAQGGPVTVTHPEMRRYFMTIPEAVQLVLQAAVLGKSGATLTLDMGDPIRIVDLARDMIELSGREIGHDVPIEFIGLRPGEKLFEELFLESETYHRTRHEKIFIAENGGFQIPDTLLESIAALEEAAARQDNLAMRAILQRIIPEYAPPDQHAPQ